MTDDLIERLTRSMLRFLFPGWRIFRSVKYDGTPASWCAAAGSSSAWTPTAGGGLLKDGAMRPDLVMCETPQQLAAELRKRLGQ